MRATLDIDADILKAAKALAETERKTLGQVLSELVRKGLAETPSCSLRLAGEALYEAGRGAGRLGQADARTGEEAGHADDTRHRR